jgi:hypothetical protein
VPDPVEELAAVARLYGLPHSPDDLAELADGVLDLLRALHALSEIDVEGVEIPVPAPRRPKE